MTASITKLPVTVTLKCLSCGATGSGSCHCGAGYVPAGEYAAKVARERPELSSGELAERTGVSQRTAVRALRTAREPFGSLDAVVIGRDGKAYPATGPAQRQPLRLAGGDDLRSAKSHIGQILMAFKRDLGREEWDALVRWLREKTWETRH